MTILIVFFDRVDTEDKAQLVEKETNSDEETKLDKKTIFSIFKIKNFWALAVFCVGAAAVFDVFDQQFIVYFRSFFTSVNQGTIFFGYMTSAQIGLELLMMIPMPYIVNKLGAKKGLIAFGFLTSIRILMSALAPNYAILMGFRLLAGLEMPLLLVSIMKYVANTFDRKIYATVYILAFSFAKQVSVFILSTVAGSLYDKIGFQSTYLFLGALVFAVTLIGVFFLTNDAPEKALKEQASPVK
ncbi:MFS transporter, OHS family, lactose permease [Enterococcus sp. DIV0788_1]